MNLSGRKLNRDSNRKRRPMLKRRTPSKVVVESCRPIKID